MADRYYFSKKGFGVFALFAAFNGIDGYRKKVRRVARPAVFT